MQRGKASENVGGKEAENDICWREEMLESMMSFAENMVCRTTAQTYG